MAMNLRRLSGRTFTSIELVHEDVRIYGETAIITGESPDSGAQGPRATCLAPSPLVGLHESGRNMRPVHVQTAALQTEPRLDLLDEFPQLSLADDDEIWGR